VAPRQALVEPDAFDHARERAREVVGGRAFPEGQVEVLKNLLEHVDQPANPLRVLLHARHGDLLAPEAVGDGAEPERPEVRVVHRRLAAVERSALGLGGEAGVDPLLCAAKVAGSGVLDPLDPVARAEGQRHRLRLESGLAAEQVRDRAAIQYDAISDENPQDTFWGGPTDDESMLERIQGMVDAGFGDRVLVSTDSCVVLNPSEFQYSRDPNYVFRTFAPKLEARIGKTAAARAVFRDNVIRAFRRGSQVGAATRA
jgi:hypothetical protein